MSAWQARRGHVDRTVHHARCGGRAFGPYGSSRTWYRIGEGHHAPGAFVDGVDEVPECPDVQHLR